MDEKEGRPTDDDVPPDGMDERIHGRGGELIGRGS
jgi:hypothetical protein